MVLPTCERNRNAAAKNLESVNQFVSSFNLETGKLAHIKNRLERVQKYAEDFEEWQSECEKGVKTKDAMASRKSAV